MPFLSDKQMEKLNTFAERAEKAKKRVVEKAEKSAGQAKLVGEVTLGAVLAGYISGRFGDAEGHIAVGGFKFDPGLALGIGGVLSSMFDLWGKHTDDALNVSSGMIGLTAGKYFFGVGSRGKAKGTLIGNAGEVELLGPAGGAGTPSSFYLGADPIDAWARAAAG